MDGIGETIGGVEASVAVTGPNGLVALSWTAILGATSYRIYRGTASGQENVYYTSPTNSFTDTGAAGTSGRPPGSTTAYINKLAASGNSWLMGGNVGIGTKTPGTKLDVIGMVKASNLNVGTGTSNTNYKILVTSSDTPSGWPAVYVDQRSPASSGPTYGVWSPHTGGAAASQKAYAIAGASTGTGTTGGKNIGGAFSASGNTTNYAVNITAPNAGTDNYAIYSPATANSYFAGNIGIGTTNVTNILTIQQNSSTDPIADAWTTYSSKRWKRNIKLLDRALEKIQQLRGITYERRDDGKRSIGLVAEEVGEVIPEVVTYEANGVDAKALDYSRLVAVLVEAVKEQQKEINDLSTLVSSLAGSGKRKLTPATI